MTAIAIIVLVSAVLSLTAVALGAFAVWHVRALAGSVEGGMEAARDDFETRAESLRERLDALAAEFRELERQPAVTLTPGLPKPGMNVVKRSQALRMHRRGDPPEQIAAALELPRQEVDLLLKVHSIVISSI
ncbi:MAG TPA: hypothetical protein VKF41_03720 [Bryobacteraceae bacterium]|nr:hypothetical protein [Bryobacteraceae bacterium]